LREVAARPRTFRHFLDIGEYSQILRGVAAKKPNRTKHSQPLYLEPEKAVLLDELAAATRIAKAVLLREAVDDLLTKHGKLKASRPKSK
jgi:hypothetical protein